MYEVGDEKEIEFRVLPAGSTDFMQPLDLYCFQQWKYFVKRFTETIIVEKYGISLHNRNTILILNSLILSQFRSELFVPMLRYSWSAGGFSVGDVDDFQNVTELCFSFLEPRCSQHLQVRECFHIPYRLSNVLGRSVESYYASIVSFPSNIDIDINNFKSKLSYSTA
jgi:hypothetical protein